MACSFFHLLFVNRCVVCYGFYNVNFIRKKKNW
jgi:hypothetical protein